MSLLIAGKPLLQRVVLSLLAASLSGCFDGGSSGNGGVDASPVAEQPSTATPAPSAPNAPNAPSEPRTNQPPEVEGTPSASVEAGKPYSFQPVARDADEDFLEFAITNKPEWATFDDTNGLLAGTPGAAHVGDNEEIIITVTDGQDTRSIGPFTIRVEAPGTSPPPGNRAPTIRGTPPPSVLVDGAYLFDPEAADPDGDRLRFSISNRPSWASFNATTGRLSGTPRTANVGTYSNIVISVNDGHLTRMLPAFAIQVQGPDNRAPVISGTPTTSVQATQSYNFTVTASDPDGDRTLVYRISNLPRWANFSTASGILSGTPGLADVGAYSNIVISVSDGRASASLPAFTLTVTAPTNRAPTISGTPATSATVGAAYSFTPSARDPEGGSLGFTIANRPSWAAFDTATGRLSGTPTATGTFANIVINVSDGRLSASLPAFTIAVAQAANGSAVLSWTPPTQNTDGSALSNLAGYRVVYGRSRTALDHSVQIANPGVSRYTITGLSSGTWYFAVKAYTNAGVESDVSNGGSKTIL